MSDTDEEEQVAGFFDPETGTIVVDTGGDGNGEQ